MSTEAKAKLTAEDMLDSLMTRWDLEAAAAVDGLISAAEVGT